MTNSPERSKALKVESSGIIQQLRGIFRDHESGSGSGGLGGCSSGVNSHIVQSHLRVSYIFRVSRGIRWILKKSCILSSHVVHQSIVSFKVTIFHTIICSINLFLIC
jgi:hypothetical protein